MLARVTGGKSGIVEYLKDGIKSGRELSRDQLDNRVCLDGNLELTQQIINSMDSKENYLHITLSFSEKDFSNEKIAEVYQAYKERLMSAYDSEEYNIYAEIHQPKIKSYKDKKTGEKIERFPHVHIVLPKKHLLTNKQFNPFGKYTDSENYHDSIQETINREFKLSSPYDNQRKINFEGNSKFISRYKGDAFKGANVKLKSELFDAIIEKNIKSKDDFIDYLTSHGEVKYGKLGSKDEYIKFKPHGENKNIRLTESCFKPDFIENRELKRIKPSDDKIYTLLDDWVNVIAHEKKFIHPASPKIRKQYYSLSPKLKEGFLNDRKREFENKYFPERGRAADLKPSINRIGTRKFTDIPNGLSSLPKRNLVRSGRERPIFPQGVLHDNEKRHLVATGTRGDHQLRRPNANRRGRGIRDFDGLNTKLKLKHDILHLVKRPEPKTLTERLLSEHLESAEQNHELQFFRVLRRDLKASNLLKHLSVSHGLDKEDYQIINAKDGSQRIKTGTTAYNVSDFCTKHMHMSWNETKGILIDVYQSQVSSKRDKQIVNSISFASHYTTSGYTSKSKQDRLNESIMILKHLQRLEQQGINDMALSDLAKLRTPLKSTENSISGVDEDTTSLTKTADMIKRSRELARQLEGQMSDIVARKDLSNGKVEFRSFEDGKVAFTDTGNRITLAERQPDIRHIGAAMELAAEKFGVLKISGTKEFKQQVIDVAVAKNLKVVFNDKKMQADFIKARTFKDENESNVVPLKSVNTIDNTAKQQTQQSKSSDEKSTHQANFTAPITKIPDPKTENNNRYSLAQKEPEKVVITEHGEADYLFFEGSAKSYFVKLSNGDIKWGKGLKEAMVKSKAQIGDEVSLQVTDKKGVTVTEDIKDDDGNIVNSIKKDTHYNEWKIDIISKGAKENNQESINSDKLETDTIKDELSPQKEQKTVAVTYKWDAKNNTLDVYFNDNKPSKLDNDLLEKIRNNDKFLKNYTIEDIQTGKLDLSVAGQSQAIPQTFDNKGEPLEVKPITHDAPKMKQ
ncbi:LPD7 domain-containing protein [uncultured Shewanella sp.]|uniref:LPD7 domain-containing protein n=1 Tax=uncultured Shewanella sp. TaxID=173975 RepID=UPI00262E6039|nr:LPD7 domain-containing protein [uncultured Shewanella sp.]